MKNEGFTLIELLAVILILGIIALIGIPTVNNIINEAKLNSKVETTNGIIDAIDNYSVISAIKGSSLVKGKIIEFNNDGTAHFSGETEIIDLGLKGEKPASGKVYIDTLGNITVEGLVFNNNIICNMTKGDKGCIQATINNDGNVIDNKAISYIKDKADGALVDDPSDSETRMIFRGDNNIHNYININENNTPVKYRIVSIESDGTIKVIRDERLANNIPWDSRINENEGLRLNSNNTYCIKEYGIYNGCNAWNAVDGLYSSGSYSGTITTNASLNDYLNKDFYNIVDIKYQHLIVNHLFNTGLMKWKQTLNQINSQIKLRTWQGKIGLIDVKDWFNATTAPSCNPSTNGFWDSTKSNKVEDHTMNYPCSDENYLYKVYWWWTLSICNNSCGCIFTIYGSGRTGNDYSHKENISVRPAFYITSNINLSGEGTSASPFIIK